MSSAGTTRAVFRISPLTILFALALVVLATPVAFGAPYLWLVYLLPVGIAVWTLRTRTVVDGDGVRVRRVAGSRHVPWDGVSALRIDDRDRVRAVLATGDLLTLPAVRVRDLPQVAAASGGRVPDPTAS